jgi:hypothetical protein
MNARPIAPGEIARLAPVWFAEDNPWSGLLIGEEEEGKRGHLIVFVTDEENSGVRWVHFCCPDGSMSDIEWYLNSETKESRPVCKENVTVAIFAGDCEATEAEICRLIFEYAPPSWKAIP